MPNIKKDDVKLAVTSTVAGFRRMDPSSIDLKWELKKQPLSFNDNDLAFMTKTLSGYVEYFSQKEETLYVKEVRKSGLTVEKLIQLIYNKLKNK